jgi:hypothetical protein
MNSKLMDPSHVGMPFFLYLGIFQQRGMEYLFGLKNACWTLGGSRRGYHDLVQPSFLY